MINHKGFTLIEVLVALAILSIALTAVIKSTAQNIQDTRYIQQKTIAAWTGRYVMDQIRVGLIHAPNAPEETSEEITMLGFVWRWKANLLPSANPRIQEIHVAVFQPEKEDDAIVNLTGYLYAQ